MKQYSKRMVIVHWLSLALLVGAWLLGEELSEATEEGMASIAAYVAHAAVGAAVLLFTLARLVFRSADGVPPPMGATLMDKVAKGIHHALYTLLILLPVSGTMTLLTSGAGKALLSGDATQLPTEAVYEGVMALEVHEALVSVLILLVVVHVLGALKHQFVMKDGLMERMSLRRKD